MGCPCCGSPARILGNRWECGYCGDSGFLGPNSEAELTWTMTVSYPMDYSFERTKRFCPSMNLPVNSQRASAEAFTGN